MKKLDLRTMIVMLVVFVLGYLTCLAMPATQAEPPDITVVDRLVVTNYIEFANGIRLYGLSDVLYSSGNLQAQGYVWAREGNVMASRDVIFVRDLKRDAITIVDSSCNLKNIRIEGNDVTSDGVLVKGLNADQLDGYNSEDFVLDGYPQWFK